MNTKTMKDNWIQAFQEKLGDYELELPDQAAAGRKTGRILPLLFAGAAAAVLLLLVLLRTPGPSRTEPISRLVAEARPVLDAPALSPLAPVTLLPERRHRVAAAQPVAMQPEAAQPADTQPEAVQPTTQPEAPPEPVIAYGKEEEAMPEEPASRRRTRLSGRVHVDPSFLQSRGATQEPLSQIKDAYYFGNGTGQDAEPWPAMDLPGENNDQIALAPEKGEVRCDLPVKAGIALQLDGPGRFAFGTGLDYAFHRSRIRFTGGPEWEYRMHYIGLPVRGLFTLIDAKRLNWYAAAGGEVEWMVAGRLYKRNGRQQDVSETIDRHPFLFSLSAATGLELKLSEHIGLYAEPGIAWHPKQKGDLPDYYREHPLSFDLRVGMSFDLR